MARLLVFILISLLSILTTQRGSRPLPPDAVSAVIRRSVEANARDWKAAPDYDYFERDQQPRGGSKTFEILMIQASPYERLLALNGKPLSSEQQIREQQNLEAAIVQRRGESDRERAERIRKYEKDRKRDQLMMEELTKAFDFTFAGDQKLDTFDVYLLNATPRTDYQPPNRDTEVLRGMQGRLWIDKETFQWVRVEAQVIKPVSIEGFLAQVEPGTRFELEKRPVADNIWFPRHFAMKSRARIFFFFSRKSQVDESYYGYHKACQN